MTIWAVMRRELAAYFYTPLGWAILTLFLLVEGYAYYLLLELVAQYGTSQGDVTQLFFGGTLLYWLFAIVVVAVTTMRLFAEEQRSGTLETLLTAPVRTTSVVVGKFLGANVFYLVLWAPTVVYVWLLARLSEGSAVDWGAVAAGYLGTLSIGAACLAVGLLCSALSRHQVMAAMMTFAVLAVLVLLGPMELFVVHPAARALIEYVNLFGHMDELARGVVDSRRLLFHATIVVVCLTAAVQVIDGRRQA